MARSSPFVLCYTGFDAAELCIDASLSSNEMKYVRCSCSPNAKVSLGFSSLIFTLNFLFIC